MNNFTYKFSKDEVEKLKIFFINVESIFSTQQYAIFKANVKGVSAVLYESGKLVVQGKSVDDFVLKLAEYMGISVDISIDKNPSDDEEIKEDYYIGVDESGKGDFFGPLVVAGVAVTPELKKMFTDLGIKDSKQLDDKKILELAQSIKKYSKWSVVVIGNAKYNELYLKFKNLNKLLAWGHARVIENLLEKAPECTLALSDKFAKNDNVIEKALMTKGQAIKMVQKTKGENDIAVAAASVIARAEFVSKMKTMSNFYKTDFPKGASDLVLKAAKEYCEKYGKQRLNEVAKLHFKTAQNI